MAITTQDFTTIVRNSVAAIQGSVKTLQDLTVGSILRSVVEANAAVVLWLQALILQLLAATRASTSNLADLDTWVADFGLTRLAAVAATGQLTFSRFTATQQAVITIGATTQTADGSQQYTVTLDATNVNYSASLGGYVLAAGVASISVPVAAVVPGAAGNAVIGQITVLTQPISGVDTVTNAAAFTNGFDAESDSSLRTRFISFIASLSKGTKGAVNFAVTSLKQGTVNSFTENLTYGGAVQNGYFFVVVDDGTGTPPGSFLTTVANAIEAVRPATSTFGVFAPVVVTANVSMTVTTAAGYDHAAVVLLVTNAIKNYINALVLGQSLTYSRLTQLAYDASPGVTNVTAVLLNSGTADLTATALQVIKFGTVGVA